MRYTYRLLAVLLAVIGPAACATAAGSASTNVGANLTPTRTIDVETAGADLAASSDKPDASVTIRVLNNLTPATRAFIRVEPPSRRADAAHQFGRRAGLALGVVEPGDTYVFRIQTPSFPGGYRLTATTGDRRTLLSQPLPADDGTTVAWDMNAAQVSVR